MADDQDDQDDYVKQLQEVFDRCDTEGKGVLDRRGLLDLCQQLQLEDQADQLLRELLGDSTDGQVDFETFKEAFVTILSSVDFGADNFSIGGASDADDDISISSYLNPVSDADILDEVSPKYVKGEKKYGRRSKPEFDNTADISDVETDISSYAEPLSIASHHGMSEARGRKRQADRTDHGRPTKRNSVSFADDMSQASLDLERELDFDNVDEPSSPERVDGEGTSVPEMFEDEGQNNASPNHYAGSPTHDQSHIAAIQAIWEEVGVGKDGFLDIDGLKVVCEHIGMDDMDSESLDSLFVKLDEDKDGRVGFDEFLQGLFSHTASATPTPIPIGMSPAQRANLRRLAGSAMGDPYMRAATPSLLNSQYIKLFSILDPDNTGYARPEDIREHLELQGIDNPMEAMEILDFNMEAGKVSLQDLSTRLEHILLAKGDDDDVYQVALTAFQSELKYIRSHLETVIDERDHLKADLTEANQRISILAQDFDERHSDIQTTNANQLKAIEDRYKDKIASLQAQIEKERDHLTTEEAGVRDRLQAEIEQLKGEDAQHKDKFGQLQKENERLEDELVEATERLIDNEKTIQKQQRDLEGFQELEERLADLESNRDSVSREQEEYFESNIKEYQEKIKLMQDTMDELTQENELLKNQGSERRLRRRTSRLPSGKPARIGSVLSDYTNKPNVHRRGNSSSDNESELDELDPNMRRQLPARSGGDGTSNEEEERKKLEEERTKWEDEIKQLKEEHNKELQETRLAFEHECKDIEEKYKIEIAALEEDIELKKEEVRNEFERVRDEFKTEQAKLVEELERKFNVDRTEAQERYEREKQIREEEFVREKADLRDQLEAQYNRELDNRITAVKQQLLAEKAELENLLIREKSDVEKHLLKAKNEAEMKLKQREMDFLKEKGEFEDEFGQEKSELLQKYNAKVRELEQILINGEAGLKGQLRQDFNNMLDQHKAEMEESFNKERQELLESLEREKEEMNDAFEQERVELLKGHDGERSDLVERVQKEKADLVSKHKKDKLEMLEKHRREKSEMTNKFKQEKDALNEKHKKERTEWEQKLQKERERFKKEREDREEKHQRELSALELNLAVDKDNLEHTIQMEAEDKIRQDLKREMEEDYVEQMQRLKSAFDDEKAELVAEKEDMEDRLRANSVNRLETVARPVVAQQVHALQSPMHGGQGEQHANMVSVLVQTNEDFPDTKGWVQEKRKLEKRLHDAEAQLGEISKSSFSDDEDLYRRKKNVDEDTQTEGVEMVDSVTSTTVDEDVVDGEMEVETGAIDNIQKFFTGLFGDGPKSKGIQTEKKPVTERIIQTDINAKYFGEKHILEQKLRDSEALSEEMAKTLHSMAYTEKAWAQARRMQNIDEDCQTDEIDMVDEGCLTDGKEEMVDEETMTEDKELVDEISLKDDDKVKMLDKVSIKDTKVEMIDEGTMTDDNEELLNEVARKKDEVEMFNKISLKDTKVEMVDAETMTDDLNQEGNIQQVTTNNTETMPETSPKDAVEEEMFDESLQQVQHSPNLPGSDVGEKNVVEQECQVGGFLNLQSVSSQTESLALNSAGSSNDTSVNEEEIDLLKAQVTELQADKQILEEKLQSAQAFPNDVSKNVPLHADKSFGDHSGERPGYNDQDTQTLVIELVDNMTSTSQDKIMANNSSVDGVVEADVEVEAGTIDNIQKFFTGLFGDGPKAKGIQTEKKPITERKVQTDIDAKYFKEKYHLEQRLRDSEALADEMSKTLQSMAYTEKAWEEARRLQRVDEDAQTDEIQMLDEESMTDDFFHSGLLEQADIKEMESHDLQGISVKPSEDEMFSVSQQEREQEFPKDHVSGPMKQSSRFKESGRPSQDIEDVQVGTRYEQELDSLKMQVAQLEADKHVLEEKLRASKALSEVMAASMQSLAQSNEMKLEVDRLRKTYTDGQLASLEEDETAAEEISEEACEFRAAENFHLRLIEGEDGELETVMIQTGRVGGFTRQDTQWQERRVVSDDLKEMLQDVGNEEDLGDVAEETVYPNDSVVEEALLPVQVQPKEYQMPRISEVPCVNQETQTTAEEDSSMTSAYDKCKVTMVDCGTTTDQTSFQDGSLTVNNGQVSPEDEILQRDVVKISSESFELMENEHRQLHAKKVKASHLKSEKVRDGEIYNHMADSLRSMNDTDKDWDEWELIDEDAVSDHIQEAAITNQGVQISEYQMPHIKSVFQKHREVQVDILKPFSEERDYCEEHSTSSEKQAHGLGPDGALLQEDVLNIPAEGFELMEDEHGHLQTRKLQSEQKEFERVSQEEIYNKMAENLKNMKDNMDDEVAEWENTGEDVANEEVQEESIVQKQVQLTEYEMPHMSMALQQEQGVQVDILLIQNEELKGEIAELQDSIEVKREEVRNEFERVRKEFKIEQARVVRELEDKFNAERIEADEQYELEKQVLEEEFAQEKAKLQDQLESNLGDEILQRDVVKVLPEDFELIEDEHGQLQTSSQRLEDLSSGKLRQEVPLNEIAESLNSINDLDKDEDEWEHINEDDTREIIQEESVSQQQVQLTEFQMPYMSSALQKEQGIQVEMLPSLQEETNSESKLIQTIGIALASKEIQTLKVKGQETGMQTLVKEISSKSTLTEISKVKEAATQLEMLKLKDQSSQWESTKTQVGVQTTAQDVSNIKTQTEKVAHKDKTIQSEKMTTESRASQWMLDIDQMPVSKPVQTVGNQLKNQNTQTSKAIKALTKELAVQVKSDNQQVSTQTEQAVQVKSDNQQVSTQTEQAVQVKSDNQQVSTQTEKTKMKDQILQAQLTTLHNTSTQWELSNMVEESVQTENKDVGDKACQSDNNQSDAKDVACQSDDLQDEFFEDEPIIQSYTSVLEQSVPSIVDTVAQASQTEVVVSDTGTFMEPVVLQSQACQVEKPKMKNRSCQWEKNGESLSMSMQTESKMSILSSVQTDKGTTRDQGQQASVEQTHKGMQHSVIMQHDSSQTKMVATFKATQTELITEDQKIQTDSQENTSIEQGLQASVEQNHKGTQYLITVHHDHKMQTDGPKSMTREQSQQASVEQTHKAIQHHVTVQHDSSQTKTFSAVKVTQTELHREDQKIQTDRSMKIHKGTHHGLTMHHDSCQTEVVSANKFTQTELMTEDHRVQTDIHAKREGRVQTESIKPRLVDAKTQINVEQMNRQIQANLIGEKDVTNVAVQASVEQKEKHVQAGKIEKKAVISEVAREEAIQVTTVRQLHAAQPDTSVDKSHADEEEQNLTRVSSIEGLSETTEGPDEILSPLPTASESTYTASSESEANVMGILRKAPLLSNFLPEKEKRPRKERRRKRDRVRKLPSVPDRRQKGSDQSEILKSYSTNGKYPMSDETSGEDRSEFKSKKSLHAGSPSSERQLPALPVSESVAQKEHQPRRHPRMSDLKEGGRNAVPQRTHGELSSQDSLFSRLFPRQDSKIPNNPDASFPDKEPLLRSSSVTFESASVPRRAPPPRPSDLGPLQRKSSAEAADIKTPKSPLTEQVTQQKDKLTQMLNLLRPDLKTKEENYGEGHVRPQRSSSLPSMPEQEFLHKQAMLPLELHGTSGDVQHDATLHPSSSRGLYRQRPSDGQEAPGKERPSYIPGSTKFDPHSGIKTDVAAQSRMYSPLDIRLSSRGIQQPEPNSAKVSTGTSEPRDTYISRRKVAVGTRTPDREGHHHEAASEPQNERASYEALVRKQDMLADTVHGLEEKFNQAVITSHMTKQLSSRGIQQLEPNSAKVGFTSEPRDAHIRGDKRKVAVGTRTPDREGRHPEVSAETPDDRASYEALARKQDMLADTVHGLEEKINQGVITGHMTKQARMEMLEENCDRLKQELSETGKKLLETEMQLSIMQAQHQREVQRLKDKQDRDTAKEVEKLKKELLEKDYKVHDLERTLSSKAEQLGQAGNRSKDELNQEVKEMRDQKAELEKKYRNTQRLLDEYMRKLKEQLTRSTKSDILAKELYVENSKLQKALQVTEERQKIAERNCHNLREKNYAYLHVLRRVVPAAM